MEMRMVYSVYRPAISDSIKQASLNVGVKSDAANQEWPQSENASVTANPKSAWRFLAAAGTLAGTLIVWEVAST